MVVLGMAGVVKRYRRGRETILALDGVDLEVAAGEFVGLVGKSGSGKSTLLHLAGGLDTPDAGVVTVHGRDVADLSRTQLALLRRRDVGFVFQFFHLIPTMSVTENVGLPLLLDGGADRDRVGELLERVGIGDRADHLPAELSGGEMQRAAIARALVAQPSLILADEPTGNLDSATGAEILDLLIEQVAASGAALLMVTHDASAASRADRVLHLRDGHLREGDGRTDPSSAGARPSGTRGRTARRPLVARPSR